MNIFSDGWLNHQLDKKVVASYGLDHPPDAARPANWVMRPPCRVSEAGNPSNKADPVGGHKVIDNLKWGFPKMVVPQNGWFI